MKNNGFRIYYNSLKITNLSNYLYYAMAFLTIYIRILQRNIFTNTMEDTTGR